MSLIQSPCKDCPDRRVLCHSECEKYLSYRARLDEISAQLLRDSIIEDYEYKAIRRSIKRRNKR